MKLGILAEFRQIFRLAAPPRWAVTLIIALGLVAAALEAVSLLLFIPLLQSLGASSVRPGVLERSFQTFLGDAPHTYATALLVLLLLVTICLKNAVSLMGSWATRHVEGNVAHRLRKQVFDQTLSSGMDYRPEGRRADILTTMSDHSWKVATALSLVFRLIISLCAVAAFIGLMTLISFKLVLIAIACLIVCALVIRSATRAASQTGEAAVQENKRFGQRMLESMHSLQLIRTFGREQYESERFEVASQNIRRRLLKLDILWSLPAPISETCIALLIGALIIAAQSSGIGLAALAAFLSLLYRLQGPMKELTQAKVSIEGMGGAIQDVAQYLKASERPFLPAGHQLPTPLQHSIEFRNMSFRYGADEPWALRNVSFDIPMGKTTAIVGRSGAGKTSLMSLLYRFYDPVEGVILADGKPISDFALPAWRGRLALMSQEVQLFNDTIEANIGYGDLNATQPDIHRAAEIAHADEFIRTLPKGYQTIVGDQGIRLSGGQRQRIALARTILRNPDILMLDEATNSLDVEAERAFQLALEQYAHKRTVIVIAHRLTTVQRADQIIVMENGRVVEAGPPDRLLDSPGHFARLYSLYRSDDRTVLPDVANGL